MIVITLVMCVISTFVEKGHRPQIETLDDLKFYQLGAQYGSEYPQELAEVLVKREDVKLIEQNFQKLVENRIVGQHIASKMGILDQIEVVELPVRVIIAQFSPVIFSGS